MYPQSVITLDMVRHWISPDNITEGPVAELEIVARVWERSKTDRRVSIENGRMLDVM